MADERRANNEKIAGHMGKVEEFMRQDIVWKENFLKRNINQRLTTVETQQKWVVKLIGIVFISSTAFFTKNFWLRLFH